MFSMEEIGRKILSLRKSRNMTQVNLADKLGITYQAVSSWERGNSMPDIEKLPEIAKLFEISIDELIGESKVVTMMLNTSEQEPENFEKLTEEDITEVLPILKPDQITEVVNGVNKSALKDINRFLPFMEPEDVKEFATIEVSAGNSIGGYLPFLNEEDILEFATESFNAGNDICIYLPFLKPEDVKEFAAKAFSAGNDIRGYLPFLSPEDVNDVFTEIRNR
ncbi:putative uncharacterized protein [Roseburia sp. CAG:309]|nr:putative uncharacterized protein [Roseburia sp. CAG:309]